MAVAVVGAAVALAAACSTSQAAAPPGQPGPAAAPAKQASLNAAAEVEAQLQDARYRLYDKCMAAKGFTLHPTRDPADPARYAVNEPPPPEVANVDDARRYGYRISEGPPVQPTQKVVKQDPFLAQPKEVLDRYQVELTGPGNPTRSAETRPGDKERDVYVMPDGSKKFVYKHGCEPEVDRAVLGDVKRYIELRHNGSSGLDRAVHDAAQADAEVTAARSAWVSCMSGKGYPAMANPGDAAKKAELYYQGVDQSNPDSVRQAKDKEVAQAVAHAECAGQTGIDTKIQAAWHRELAEYLDTHETDLVAWQDFAKGALDRAQRMLAG